jgi:exopolysaccharide biosynthesis WecB/TagA/CpsF family protein
VAFYMHDLSGGGVERMRLSLIRALQARGLAVTLIVSHRQGPLAALLPNGLDVVELGLHGVLRSVLPLARVLRRVRPDVLVASLDHNNVTAMLARSLGNTGARLVICQHNALSAQASLGWRYRAIPYLYWALQRAADAIVAVSQGVADDLSTVTRIAPRHITPIYNPVIEGDFGERCNRPAPHPWLTDGGAPVLVFAGRLTAQKDPGLLLEALALLQAHMPARLMLLGDGPLLPALEAQAARLGVSEHVVFAGFQDNPLPWISRAACLVSASLYEGLGNVLIEALACGTPVVATDCPHGPAEILLGGAAGSLVPVGDAGGMATAIARTLAVAQDRAALRARGLCFTASACADAHLALFKSFQPQGCPNTRAFGLPISNLAAAQIVERIMREPATEGAQLIATPNIDHVRLLRRPDFSAAYRAATLLCPDGFPVLMYARMHGTRLRARVTGCELFRLIANHAALQSKSVFVVVESEETESALRAWARGQGLFGLWAEVAPAGLSAKPAVQEALARRIQQAAPDILIITLGAPLSEVFIDQHRHILPCCWALCVGQAVRIHLGLVARAPAAWQGLGLEWLWRIRQEPRRLLGRYVRAAFWFPVAVWQEERRSFLKKRTKKLL